MAERELADFDPTTGHLHTTCAPHFDGYTCHGDGETPAIDCAAHLYAIAQDAEKALHELTSAPVLLVLHPGGRAVLTVADGVPDYDLAHYFRDLAHDVEAGRHRTPPAEEPSDGQG